MRVRILSAILMVIVSLGFAPEQRACAQTGADPLFSPSHARHTQVRLLLSADTAKAGDTILAGVELKMESGWHTYWKNPGDSGTATSIAWTLPKGITAGPIDWPLPEKLPPAEVTTYGYEGETVLVVPLTIGPGMPPGPVKLSTTVAWLECMDVCVPASQTVEATLNIGDRTQPSADAATIELWKSKVPQADPRFQVSAYWEAPASGDTRSLLIRHVSNASNQNVKYDSVDFFPAASDAWAVQPATEILSATPDDIELRKQVKKFSGDWPKEIGGVLVIQAGKERYGFDVTIPVAEHPPETAAAGLATLPAQPLWRMLLYAFIGGLILNIMPCVLPVIALKILGFVEEARSEPGRVRKLGIVYALGVVVSFLTLAGIVIGVRAAGHHAGWGMQFGSPIFIVCLITLVTLVALNLFGVFEVALSGRVMDSASNLASRSGVGGAFFNGVLATALATPCTAPFLAPALGFAFAQDAAVIVTVFLFVGLGLSAPYILLSWHPAWLRFLPKPGAWMEKFKITMGFPMLATVIWLYYIASGTYGREVAWLGLFLVLVAMAAWIFGQFVQRGRKGRWIGALTAALIFAAGYAYCLESELNWRHPAAVTAGVAGNEESADGIHWQPWSPQAVAEAQAAGRPVLVDFTADWCLTCQLNKKTSIEIPAVREKLKALNGVALIADYTHSPDAITDELNRFNRAGVPLVLVFPKKAGSQPIVLPSILTPGIVLAALEQAN
jgi:thiol:disulfide interchange protein DsbD